MRAFVCSPGSEPALADELARAAPTRPTEQLAPGVVALASSDRADEDAATNAVVGDPIFARQALPGAVAVDGASVRALAEGAFAAVDGVVDGWPGPFSLHALAHAEPPPGLASRASLVAQELRAIFEGRRRRAWRRHRAVNDAVPDNAPPASAAPANAPPDRPAALFDESCLLLQLLALSREHFIVSAAAPRRLSGGGFDLSRWPGGEAPVAIDRAPPSRAYQKLEEALAWMGTAPRPGETCVDLGASPGGWTATALKRGAGVVAVDRAPVAPELARDPRVTMIIGNAFTYTPPAPVDWMLCDVVCEPPRSLALVESWLTRGLCRNLVVTVKFKGRAGYGVLDALPPLFARLGPAFARVKQLVHNKNEVTVMVRNGDAPSKMG
ncbi:MAG TPA: SAM-dependent methyltransferase [Polyangia bacterium]|nr:SAM-dependent methyltransferase [Polyangia bacterium]